MGARSGGAPGRRPSARRPSALHAFRGPGGQCEPSPWLLADISATAGRGMAAADREMARPRLVDLITGRHARSVPGRARSALSGGCARERPQYGLAIWARGLLPAAEVIPGEPPPGRSHARDATGMLRPHAYAHAGVPVGGSILNAIQALDTPPCRAGNADDDLVRTSSRLTLAGAVFSR